MEDGKNYIEINKKLWDSRTEHHVGSEFYDMQSFMAGKSSLKEIELELLGDVKGKKLLHLQCHFGQDTLSLARMGAEVTGADLSGKAIYKAREIAKELSLDAKFICCDLYSLPEYLNEQFDIVFTSYGTIGWLPDMKAWAQIVARYMKPGGKFVFADFHPAMWMFDNNLEYVQYSYFNREAIQEEEQGTYADKDAAINLKSVGWNHDLAEVMQSLLDAGLKLEVFREYDYSPYDCIAKSVLVADGKYQVAGLEGKIPLVYALKCSK